MTNIVVGNSVANPIADIVAGTGVHIAVAAIVAGVELELEGAVADIAHDDVTIAVAPLFNLADIPCCNNCNALG